MSLQSILKDKNVQSLIKTMNLDVKTLNCSNYEYDPMGEAIVITEIELLDSKGCHKRFVDLEKVLPYLSEYNVTFNLK